MPSPSVTYTFVNGTAADASQVNTNFTDLINGATDGTKDYSINALTCAGTATLNGNVNLGNSSADDLTITASLASTLSIKTTNSFDIGSSTLGLKALYFGANSQTVNLKGSASMSATWTMTLPVTAGTVGYMLTTDGSGVTAWQNSINTSPTFYGGAGTSEIMTGNNAGSRGGTFRYVVATGDVEFGSNGSTGVGMRLDSAANLAIQGSGGTTDLILYNNSSTRGGTLRYVTSSGAVNLYANGSSSTIGFQIDASAHPLFPNHTTTASAANAFLNSGTGELLRSTSSKKYKKNIKSLKDESKLLYKMRPVRYKSKAKIDDPKKEFFGLIAEEMAEICPELVQYKDEIPDGVQYDRIVVLLINEIKALNKRLEKLEAKK
jgi:hypothetical protein